MMSTMADRRLFLCSLNLCLVLTFSLLYLPFLYHDSLHKEFDQLSSWFPSDGCSKYRATYHTCFLSASRGKRFYSSRVSYYPNAHHASFQLERLTRSGDTAVGLNPGPDSLRCYLQNVRSLKAVIADGDSFECKIALLKDIAYGYDLDIICLTETWLNDTISDIELFPTGYNIFRNDRKDRVGGGTLTAIKSYLPAREITPMPIDIECVVLEIDFSSCRTALFINCYRPPSDKEFVLHFKTLVDTLHLDKYWGVFLVGDFNYPGINWIDGSGFTNSLTSEEQHFTKFIMDYYLFQLVESPTRNNNILDLVITSLPSVISSIESGPSYAEAGLPSDHYPVVFDIDISLKLKDSNYKYCYDYKNADFEALNNELSLLPLSTGVDEIDSQDDLNEAWSQWCSFVFSAINTHIAKVPRRSSNKPPWISKDLAKAIKKKKTLWRRVKNSTSEQLIEKFRKQRQSIKNWIRRERKAYLHDIACEAFTNPKRFWSYYSFKNKKTPIPVKVNYNGISITDDMARAEAFNDYFKSIYKDHSRCKPPDTSPESSNNPNLLEIIQVSSNDVLSLLSSLDIAKATGPDKLSAIILKNCAQSLSPSLTVFINTSLRSGLYISEWKQANIAPIHKKGPRTEVENFRQISLLPIVSKIQEKCVGLKLVPRITEVLHPVQYGFQKGLSCASQLVEVFHSIASSLDKGLEQDIIYLDFAKAFDSVCHARLLWKLQLIGVNGPLLHWFKNYLTERKQRVVINGCHSSWAEVKSGVPQGSILGPILFLIYVNDMPDVIQNSSIAMFADDSKCFKCITSIEGCVALQSDLNALSDWATLNELEFQPKKCENLRITRKRFSFDRVYCININEELKCVSSQKDLGVNVSSNLSWNNHIDSISAKGNKMLGFLKRNCSKDMTSNTLKVLYLALVRSHLGYCSQLWAPQSIVRNILIIESVQRRATKFICKYSTASYKDRLIHLNLLPLNYWLEYLDLVFYFKCKSGTYSVNLSKYISDCEGSSRRSSSGLFIRQNCIPRTSSFRDSYFIRIVNIWNALPNNIKYSSSLDIFKCRLKEFLYNRLRLVFDQDNIRTYKLICPKCRRVNTLASCSC